MAISLSLPRPCPYALCHSSSCAFTCAMPYA